MQNANEDLARIKASYDQKLALHAPVRYWRAKALHHGISARKLARYAVWATVPALLLLFAVAFSLLVLPILIRPDWKPEFINLFAVVLIGSTVVWLMRELIKQWSSHIHLRNDAQFRVVLMRTYLSLLRSEKGIGKEEHAALVASLYRPASDGVVKEEGFPTSSLDAVSRVAGRN